MKEPSWILTLENLFSSLGLSDKEAKIYRTLLEIGEGTATKVATDAKLKRGITYAILYALTEQKLVKTYQKDGKAFFQAEHPRKLLDIVSEKKNQITSLERNIEDVYPKLNSLYKLSIGKPAIQYYEGEQGIRDVFEDIYAPKKDAVYGCVDLERADEVFPKYIMDRLIPKRVAHKVEAQSIIGRSKQSEELQKRDEEQLRTSTLVDKDEYPLPAEIDIYDDKVAMLSFAKGEFIGVIIENTDIAASFRSVFRLAMVGAKHLAKKKA